MSPSRVILARTSVDAERNFSIGFSVNETELMQTKNIHHAVKHHRLAQVDYVRLRDQGRGLTLIELLVVLAILVALGTAVVVNTTQMMSDTRAEVSKETVEAVYDGILGQEPQTYEDPTAVLPGFISDIGRLPRINQALVDGVRNAAGDFVDDEPVLTPGELWDNQPPGLTALPLYKPRAHSSDPDFEFPTGWRGPYVNLPGGSLAVNVATQDDNRAILDGLRREFRLYDTDGDLITGTGGEFAGMLGSTRLSLLPTEWAFGQDDAVGFLLRDDSDPNIPDQTRGTVTFELDSGGTESGLDDIDEDNEMVIVRLYGPVDGEPNVLAQWPREGQTMGTTPRGLHTFEDAGGTPIEFGIGVRYLRIYRWNDTIAPAETAVLSGSSAETNVEGEPGTRQFTILPGGPASPPQLEIPVDPNP